MNDSNGQGPTGSVSNIRKQTQLDELFEGLGAGVLQGQLERALSDVALGVVTHGDKGKKGKVVLTFDVARIGESTQVNVTHKLEYKQPTARGKRSEDVTGQTPFHVGRGGRLTLTPENQPGLYDHEKTGSR